GLGRGGAMGLRGGGPAAPVTTLLTMLDIARAARARDPAQEAAERAPLEAAEAAARAVEQRHALARSETYVFDRRSEGHARLNSSARSEVEAAYRTYTSAVEAWQQARALTVFTETWVADLELAAERYIEASLEFGQAAVRDGGASRPGFAEREGASAPYRRWLACYAPVLQGAPAAAGDATCARLRAMRSDLSLRRAALLSAGGARPTSAYFRLLQVDNYISGIVEDFAVGLVGLSDRAFRDLLDEVLNPVPVTAATLNATFSEAQNGQLAFRCVIDWIDADLGLRAPLASGEDAECDNAPRTRDRLDPAQFAPLDHALTLARLALLDQVGVRQVAARFGGDGAALRLGAQPRYSLLLDSVRSLDGSQLWSGRSMPFPRARAWREPPAATGAGFPMAGRQEAGFPFYQSPALRRTVFAALFPQPFEGAILRRAELQPPHYPFRPCAGDTLRGSELEGATGLTEIC
ncbi:MAG: hypothetical protein ACT4N8_08785, partial [Sphingosinicella sp.]|uniref:hypothetical protein n=1 Tax=Sphingosinicella sp. TaxID=1917971 RepID=UPI00403817C1